MKKKLGMLLAVLLTFCMTVGVFADAGKTQQVDYKTDYYMIVESTCCVFPASAKTPTVMQKVRSTASNIPSFFFIYILFSLLHIFLLPYASFSADVYKRQG